MVLSVWIRDSELSVGDVFFVIQVEDLDVFSNPRTWRSCRRYRHFDTLRGMLQNKYPLCILPPLPTKSTTVASIRRRIRSYMPSLKASDGRDTTTACLSSTSSNLAETMYEALEVFIRHMLQHQRIRESDILLAFLCDDGKWLEIYEKISPLLLDRSSVSRPISINAQDQSEIVQSSPSESLAGDNNSGNTLSVSACMANEKLLGSRANGIQTFWYKFSLLAKQLNGVAVQAHRQHQRLSTALCDWAPYEKAAVLPSSNTILTVARKLRRFANSMDTAEEESASLMEQCLLWQNYAKYSIAEVRNTYRKMLADLNAKYQQDVTQLTKQICQAASRIAEETTAFESLHRRGGADLLTEFAAVQLRQTERFHATWLEILDVLQSARPDRPEAWPVEPSPDVLHPQPRTSP